jgi:CRISPR-associated protein Csb2
MGIHRRVQGGDLSKVSQTFSGKTAEGEPLSGHNHAYYIPLDLDRDGKIDHLRIFAGSEFTSDELVALDRFRKVFGKGGHDIYLHLTGLHVHPPQETARRFVSATPFVTARHWRKGRGTYEEWLFEEIARECSHHGLPQPVSVRAIETSPSTARPVRWWEFKRARKGAAPMRGHGFELEFTEPVKGPFLLGGACHFGMGLFFPLAQAECANPERDGIF